VSEVPPPEHFEPDALMEALVAGGVRFILIGGLAVGVHGAVRATRDMDIVPDPERANLERLAAVLRAIEAQQIGVDTELLPHQPTDADGLTAGGSFQLATVHGELDILQESGVIPSYEALAEDAVEIEWRGNAVLVCSLERLKQMKRAAGRSLDLLDLEALEQAQGLD
jgi:hypothetical protein